MLWGQSRIVIKNHEPVGSARIEPISDPRQIKHSDPIDSNPSVPFSHPIDSSLFYSFPQLGVIGSPVNEVAVVIKQKSSNPFSELFKVICFINDTFHRFV